MVDCGVDLNDCGLTMVDCGVDMNDSGLTMVVVWT